MKGNNQSSFWKTTKLNDVCLEITVGHVGPMASKYIEEGIPFLRSQNIEPFRLNKQDIKYISDDFHRKLKKSALRPGDVAVIRTGYPGTACVIPQDLRIANCADLVIIRPSKLINSHFLASLFNSTWGKGIVAGNLVGVAQQHFNVGSAKEMMINLPPIETQQKIASILTAYDDLIENNTRRIAILEEMAQSIYREWFVHFRFPGHEKVKLVDSPMGKIPEGWRVVPLKEIYRTSSGGTPSRKIDEYFQDGTINWIKSKELQDRFIWDTEEKITQSGLDNSSAKIFPRNTVIIAMYGATIGQLAILGAESTTNQACCSFLTNESKYGHAYLFFNLLFNRHEIINLRAGAAQQNVSQDVIREMPFLTPSIDIVKVFNDLVEPFLESVYRLQQKSLSLKKTRDLLLPKLISGQLDVEDLDIEIGEKLC